MHTTNENFIENLKLNSHQNMQQIEAISEKCSQMDFTVNTKTQKIGTIENNVLEIFAKLELISKSNDTALA